MNLLEGEEMAERDSGGRFVKGEYRGGPGRPRKDREDRFYEIAVNAVTFQDWKDVILRAVSQAKRGDSSARKFLADYLMGTPIQKIAPVTPDGENPYMAMDKDELVAIAKQIAGNAE